MKRGIVDLDRFLYQNYIPLFALLISYSNLNPSNHLLHSTNHNIYLKFIFSRSVKSSKA